MRKRILLLAAIISFALNSAIAWDEVTHAFITGKVIDQITISELKQLLEENRDVFLSGSWFTDSYQYTDERINTLNPHNLDIYMNAYLSYLQKDEVKQQENYDKLVAFFFGSVAHTTEDFWLDHILYEYPEKIGETITGDTYNGVITINKFDYLDLKVVPYFPAEDLFALLTDAGMIEPEYDTPEKFEKVFKSLITKQYEQLRLLKLLSFLASNQVQKKSPWISENILSAPGGILSSATNTARYLEAMWMAMNGQFESGVLNSACFLPDRNLGMLVWFPQRVDEEQVQLDVISSGMDTLSGAITAFQFGGTMTNLVILVYHFDEGSVITEGSYTASIGVKDMEEINFSRSFEASTMAMDVKEAREPVSLFRSLGAGIFLFILCIGLAGIIWGLSSLYPFISVTAGQSGKLPLWGRILRRGLQVVGVVVLAFGFYLLVTQGWLVVLNV